MNQTIARSFLLLVAAISTFTAFAHLSCIFLGPQCFEYQMAPESIVLSAKEGTWIAPVGTLVICGIFLIWALYAASGAKVIRKLPFLSQVIYLISAACLIRGVLGIQLWLRKPELVSDFANISNWIWFLSGVCLLLGYRSMQKLTHK